MKLFIPSIGDKIRVLEDWNFRLFYDRRNLQFLKLLKSIPDAGLAWPSKTLDEDRHEWVTIPSGTILTINRIFIRQNLKYFDSITFSCRKGESKIKTLGGRFWAKLVDVYEMEYELVTGEDLKKIIGNARYNHYVAEKKRSEPS